jgi:uncharacterized membrane protein YphA (DoxX/SURF4 family)
MAKGYNNIVVSLVVVVVSMAIAALSQLVVGDVPVELFRFPLNVIIAAGWLYMVIELFRARQRNAVARYLLSPVASWLSVSIVVVVCVVMGLQRQPAVMSFPFAVATFFVLTQLAMVVLRGWRNTQGIRWRFIFNHVGLWLVLFAEIICSLGFMIGALYRLCLIPMIFTMCIAFFVIHANDTLAIKEPSLMYLTIFVLLYITGPGKCSIDAILKRIYYRQ